MGTAALLYKIITSLPAGEQESQDAHSLGISILWQLSQADLLDSHGGPQTRFVH